MAKLVFTNKEHAGEVYELTLEKTTVGRAQGNTIVIPDSSLSARHCEILIHGSEVIVRDLGSHNGTMVDGTKLMNQQSQLKSGHTVRFGAVEARLELDAPASDDTASEMTAIHSMGRIMREQKREREKPGPAAASVKLGPVDSNSEADKTVSALDSSAPAQTADTNVRQPNTSPTSHSSRKTSLLILAVIVLVIGIVAWWWARR